MGFCSRPQATLALVLLVACAPAPPEPIELALCDEPPPHALAAELPEAQPNYDDDLAALDLASLPPTLSTASLTTLQRELVAYMLEEPALGDLDRDTLLTTNMGRAVLGFFALDNDFIFLRRGFFRFYACEREQPLFLADLDVTLDADSELVDPSIPKGTARRLTHGVRADGADVYVAETDRETEVIIHGHRADDAIDFFVWDADGNATRSSTFATSTGGEVVSAAPFTCVACHRDKVNGTGFTVIRPE